jgi:hypothetical protein
MYFQFICHDLGQYVRTLYKELQSYMHMLGDGRYLVVFCTFFTA